MAETATPTTTPTNTTATPNGSAVPDAAGEAAGGIASKAPGNPLGGVADAVGKGLDTIPGFKVAAKAAGDVLRSVLPQGLIDRIPFLNVHHLIDPLTGGAL